MKAIGRILLTGLATVLPIVATFYLLFWLLTSAESTLGKIIRIFLPNHLYRPGMGVVAGLTLIFVIGILMKVWIVRELFDLGDRILSRIPFVKSLYGSTRDILRFFSRSEKHEDLRQVVMVNLGATGMSCLGFVTRNQFADLPAGIGTEESVAVYLPLSYQIGGHTVIMPRSAVHAIDMPIDQAMRFLLTAGMTTQASTRQANRFKDSQT